MTPRLCCVCFDLCLISGWECDWYEDSKDRLDVHELAPVGDGFRDIKQMS